MKKIYLLLIACLAGVFSANAQLYVVGEEFGNWDLTKKKSVTLGSDGYYTFDVTKDKEFKMSKNNSNQWNDSPTCFNAAIVYPKNFNSNDPVVAYESGEISNDSGPNVKPDDDYTVKVAKDYSKVYFVKKGTQDLYLVGQWYNSWATDNGNKFTTFDNVTYTLSNVTMIKGNEFLIGNGGSWTLKYGKGESINIGDNNIGVNGSNIKMNVDVNNATFTFNTLTKVLTIEEKSVPTLTLSSLTASTVDAESATLSYTYSASNFTTTPSVKVEYKQGASGVYQTVGTYTGANRTATISLSNLSPYTDYTYYVKVSSGTYSDEKQVSFKTAIKTPYTIYFDSTNAKGGASTTPYVYCWGDNDKRNAAYPGVAMTNVEGNIWSYTVTSADWHSLLFTTKDNSDSNKTEDYKLAPEHLYTGNAAKGDEGSEYVPPTLAELKIKINDKGNGLFTVVIDPDKEYSGASFFYTVDGTTPTTASRLYSDEFQIASTATVKARAQQGGSFVAAAEASASKHDFDTQVPNRSNLLGDFNVTINVEVNKEHGRHELTADFQAPHIDYQDDANTYEYSWAKYADYDEYEKVRNSSSTDNDYIDEIVDHLSTTPGIENTYGPNVQDNNTDKHVARNLTLSYYRVYVHSNVSPTTDPIVAKTNSLLKGASGSPEMSDEDIEARIAYTGVSDPNDGTTTGIENVIVDENVGAEDADAPVVYYNLNGVRVENPSNGIFIRVQGSKVTKELIR